MALAACEKGLRLNSARCVPHTRLYAFFRRVLGEEMKRGSKFRVIVVLFLLAILLGGSAAVSITVMEILFVLVLAIVLGVVLFSIVGSRLGKRRR